MSFTAASLRTKAAAAAAAVAAVQQLMHACVVAEFYRCGIVACANCPNPAISLC